MAELKESIQYTISYDLLSKEIVKIGIDPQDFDRYVSFLSYNILQKIEESNRVPMYAFKMILTELLIYENMERNGYTLDLMSSFQPLEDKLPDIIMGYSYMLPKSARSTLNTFDGESITSVSWKEYFVTNTP
jgi:hypothetical protein